MSTTSKLVNGLPNYSQPIVATVQETMVILKIGRAKTYELLNAGILESYLEGSSRKITRRSIEAYVERRLREEAVRRSSHGLKRRETNEAIR